MGRREFLGSFGTTAWMARASIAQTLQSAREIVGDGVIGPVTFCRVAGPDWAAAARQVCGNSALLMEVDTATSGAVLLGSAATLVVDGKGWRLLP